LVQICRLELLLWHRPSRHKLQFLQTVCRCPGDVRLEFAVVEDWCVSGDVGRCGRRRQRSNAVRRRRSSTARAASSVCAKTKQRHQ